MTTFVAGQVKTTHLCPVCAAKRKKPPAPPTMSDFMSAFYDDQDAETMVCTNCGWTLQDFRSTGRLGCAHCYQVFEPAIMPILKGVHMNVAHKGKRPGQRVKVQTKGMPKKDDAQQKVSALQRELKVAVSTENFEEAARLRDEIAMLCAGVHAEKDGGAADKEDK